MCVLFLLIPYTLVFGNETENAYLALETNKPSKDGPLVVSIGAFGVGSGKGTHINLAYIEARNKEKSVVLDLGVSVALKRSIFTIYVGGGGLVGYNGSREKLVRGYYPEAGILIDITKKFGLIASGKRYINLFSETEDVVMLGLLFGAR